MITETGECDEAICAPLSPFVRKAVIVAAEKGIEYEYDPRPSPLGWTEGFEEINPLKRIPALLPDPQILIMRLMTARNLCLFRKIAARAVALPQEAEAHGRALWIEEAADTDLANRVGMGVFRPVFFSLAAGKPADTETASKGFEALAEVLLPYLENQLGDGDWFVGDMFSIADIAVMTQLMNLDLVGFGLPQERFPICGRIMSVALRGLPSRHVSSKTMHSSKKPDFK